jgi:glycosyltransferase involved in cell wall biosynthesis
MAPAGDRAYFESAVAPLIDRGAEQFIGEIGENDRQAFLGEAKALIFPIAWPEPFGLVMIEAMACGTPVIAYDNGSVREILNHGVTGFIVRDEAEATQAVAHLGSLDRDRIRTEFESRFTSRRMALDSFDAYRRLGAGSRKKRAGRQAEAMPPRSHTPTLICRDANNPPGGMSM